MSLFYQLIFQITKANGFFTEGLPYFSKIMLNHILHLLQQDSFIASKGAELTRPLTYQNIWSIRIFI